MNQLLVLAILVFVFFYWWSQKSPLLQPTIQKPYNDNIEKLTLENNNYRQVLHTTSNMQLVLMSLQPQEEIGFEIHPTTSQFIRAEKGIGKAIIDGKDYKLEDGDVVIIPPGSNHNIINISTQEPLQLYTIYTPPNHPPQTLQPTKADDHHD